MADRYYAPPPGVRLSREDYKWLARFARQEATSVQAVVDNAVWFFRYWQAEGKKAFEEALESIVFLSCEYHKQVRRQRYFHREYQIQARRLHNMRRAHQKQLRQERNMRRAYEKQLQCQRDYCERLVRAAAEPHRDALYGPTVAKLLALAVSSESDGEARAALEKARALHRLAALFRSSVQADLVDLRLAGIEPAIALHRAPTTWALAQAVAAY
jgi:hypothetical protein